MFATVECEAAILGCHLAGSDSPLPDLLAMAGVDHVLGALPDDRWAVLVDDAVPDGLPTHLARADLPAPPVVAAGTYGDAVAALDADASVCLAFADRPDGVAAARLAGLQVVGVAGSGSADALDQADLVVPSLLSVRVVGTHPFIVFEVDALPGLGTGAARRR